MHQFYLGIAKTLFKYSVVENDVDLQWLDELMDGLHLGSDFQSWNVSFENWAHWKAIHWKYFTVYLSIPLFMKANILKPEELWVWQLFVQICTSTGSAAICKDQLEQLHHKCDEFVAVAEVVTGKKPSLNFHTMLHIVDDLKRLGMSYTHTAFPFESNLGVFGRTIQGVRSYPLQSIKLWQQNLLVPTEPKITKTIAGSYWTTAAVQKKTLRAPLTHFYDKDGLCFETLERALARRHEACQPSARYDDSFVAIISKNTVSYAWIATITLVRGEDPLLELTLNTWTRSPALIEHFSCFVGDLSTSTIQLVPGTQILPAVAFQRGSTWWCCQRLQDRHALSIAGEEQDVEETPTGLEEQHGEVPTGLEMPPIIHDYVDIEELLQSKDEIKKKKKKVNAKSLPLAEFCRYCLNVKLSEWWNCDIINFWVQDMNLGTEALHTFNTYWSLLDNFWTYQSTNNVMTSFAALDSALLVVPNNFKAHWSFTLAWKIHHNVGVALIDSLPGKPHVTIFQKFTTRFAPVLKSYYLKLKKNVVPRVAHFTVNAALQPDKNSCGFFTVSAIRLLCSNIGSILACQNIQDSHHEIQKLLGKLLPLECATATNKEKRALLQETIDLLEPSNIPQEQHPPISNHVEVSQIAAK
jgi:hypothetical protein